MAIVTKHTLGDIANMMQQHEIHCELNNVRCEVCKYAVNNDTNLIDAKNCYEMYLYLEHTTTGRIVSAYNKYKDVYIDDVIPNIETFETVLEFFKEASAGDYGESLQKLLK